MHKFRAALAAGIGAVAMVPGSILDAAEERLPTTPGTCVLTEISTISSRLARKD